MKDFMKINENDNVIVALKEMKKGEKISLENTEIEALETIPAGHKMAVKDICEGADVIKYGFRIGTAKEDIKAGQWVHTHNIKTALGDLLEYKYEPVHMEEKITEGATFLGFQRPDGKAGVRNYSDGWLCQQYCNCPGKTGECKGERFRAGSDRIPTSLWMFPDGR